MTLTEKLRARIEFDELTLEKLDIMANGRTGVGTIGQLDRDWLSSILADIGRVRPLLDALIECAEALEKIQNFETLDGDKYNSYEAGWFGVAEFAGDALARLNKLVSEGDE